MITLQSFSETGKNCPICNNGTVFKEHVYKKYLLWFPVYQYTILKCKMQGCNYKKKINNY